jgi:hypothetical protein
MLAAKQLDLIVADVTLSRRLPPACEGFVVKAVVSLAFFQPNSCLATVASICWRYRFILYI